MCYIYTIKKDSGNTIYSAEHISLEYFCANILEALHISIMNK